MRDRAHSTSSTPRSSRRRANSTAQPPFYPHHNNNVGPAPIPPPPQRQRRLTETFSIYAPTETSFMHGADRRGGGGAGGYHDFGANAMEGGGAINKGGGELVGGAPAPLTQRRNACTAPLYLIFALECTIVIAAFTAIIAYAGTQVTSTATDLIRENIEYSLLYGAALITDPMNAIEELIVDYRGRYQGTAIMHEDDYFPCDDRMLLDPADNGGVVIGNGSAFDPASVPLLFQPAAPFFRDMVMTVTANPLIDIVMVVSLTRNYSDYEGKSAFAAAGAESDPLQQQRLLMRDQFSAYTYPTVDWPRVTSYQRDVGHLISQCSVTRTSIYRRAFNFSKTSDRLPTVRELGSLDDPTVLPENDSPIPLVRADNHEEVRIAKLALTSPLFDATPIYHDGSDILEDGEGGKRLDTDGEGDGAGVFLLYTSPISYLITNLTTGARVELFQAETRIVDIMYRPDVSDIVITSALAFGCSMAEFYAILVSVTPRDNSGRSHTTIYDIDYDLMMASNGLPDGDGQYNTHGGNFSISPVLYLSGKTPSESVNDAYYESGVDGQSAGGDPRVDFSNNDGRTVISSYVFTLPNSGNHYGIVQSTPLDFYFGAVDRMRNVMIALGVVCCVIVVLVCVAVAAALRHGIGQILANMALAAAMKNDRTTQIVTFLSDVDRLARGFGKMNEKLLEARAYLPQHMLLSSSSGEEDEEGSKDRDEEGDVKTETTGRTRSRAASRAVTSGEGSVASSQASQNNNNNNNNGPHYRARISPRKAAAPGVGLGYDGQTETTATNTTGLQTNTTGNSGNRKTGNSGGLTAQQGPGAAVQLKRATILSFNARGFHKTFAAASPSTVTGPTTRLAEQVTSFANAHRGVIDSFHGDHFVISFNVARSNAEGPAKAARCALDLMRAAATKGHQCAIGIATGRAIVGNLGTSTLKRLSVIGPTYSKAMALARLCRRFNVNVPLAALSALTERSPSPQQNATDLGGQKDETNNNVAINNNNNNNLATKKATAVALRRAAHDHHLAVQCLLERAMAAEVQHVFALQALGGVYGAPFGPTVATVAEQRRAAIAAEAARRAEAALLAADTVESIDSGGVAADEKKATTAMSPHLTVPPLKTTPQPYSSAAAATPAVHHAVEMLFALRPNSGDDEADGAAGDVADEWLYELSNNFSSAGALAEINRSVSAYVAALPSPQVGGANEDDSLGDEMIDGGVGAATARQSNEALFALREAIGTIRRNHEGSGAGKELPTSSALFPADDALRCAEGGECSSLDKGCAEAAAADPPPTTLFEAALRYAEFISGGGLNDNNNNQPNQNQPNQQRPQQEEASAFAFQKGFVGLPQQLTTSPSALLSSSPHHVSSPLPLIDAARALHYDRLLSLEPRDAPRGCYFTGAD